MTKKVDLSTVRDVRDFITLQLERVAKGEITPAAANATSHLAGKMFQSIKLEMEYNRMLGLAPHIDAIELSASRPLGQIAHKPENVDQQTGEVRE